VRVGAGEPARGQRGRGVAGVVDARDGQLHAHAVEREAHAVRLEPDVLGPGDAPAEASEARLVAEHDIVGEVEERAEGVVDVALGRVRRVVVELGVGQHSYSRGEPQQRAVRLVGLDHEPLAAPPSRVGTGRAHLAAHEIPGIEAAAAQRVHDHARRRRLPVRPGDCDGGPQPRDLAEQLGAVQLRCARPALGVVGRDRTRDHDLSARWDVGGVMGPDLDAGVAQVRRIRRAVGAGHLGTERPRHARQPAHPGAADADEVELAARPWGCVGHGAGA
jgi:hypothetical protein